MPHGQIAILLPDCGFPPAARARGFLSWAKMFLLLLQKKKKKALCLALPLSELETTLNQDQYMLCSCFTVTFFNFMGRMFHNCPCNYACGRWQGAFLGNTWFLVRKGPLRGNAGTDALSEACFLNYFTSSGVPVGAWHSPKERLCACPSHSAAVTTVLWILTVPACLGQ